MSGTALGDATDASDTRAKVDTAGISVSADLGGVRARSRAGGNGVGQ
jgi:hypothetical protein